MKRMRFLIAMLVIWLFLFYNIERLSHSANISKAAYIFLPAAVAVIILVPRLRELPIGALLVTSIPAFLVLKAWTGHALAGDMLPWTITEVSAITVAILMTRWVSTGIGEFENAVAHITIGQVGKVPEPFSVGQGEIYREVRRARNYQRPLTLMAVGVEDESIKVALDRMVQEVQQAMMKQYVLSGVSKTLCDELEDYNIIAQRNHHFLVLLPEMTSEKLPEVVGRLRRAVSEQVGVNLQIGTASFPDEAITFENLVEKAVTKMKTSTADETQPSRRAKDLAAKRVTA